MSPDQKTHAGATVCMQTPHGRGGIAVLHLSGKAAGEIIEKIFQPVRSTDCAAASGRLRLGVIHDGAEQIDQAIVAINADDSAEVNIHGGPAIVQRVMNLLKDCGAVVDGCIAALPASHPKWNNPAIGVELQEIAATLESQFALAVVANQWSAGLSALANEAIRQLSAGDAKDIAAKLRLAADGLSQILRLIEPAEIVLAGPPNAGKSSLANLLVGRPVSIVHETPGTTRDWVRQRAIVNGLPVWITDTAGIWDAPNHIDTQAVARAMQRIAAADLVIKLHCHGGEDTDLNLPTKTATMAVWSKCDIAAAPASEKFDCSISAQTGEGIDALKSFIVAKLGMTDISPDAPLAFTERQAKLLSSAADAADSQNIPTVIAHLHQLLAN